MYTLQMQSLMYCTRVTIFLDTYTCTTLATQYCVYSFLLNVVDVCGTGLFVEVTTSEAHGNLLANTFSTVVTLQAMNMNIKGKPQHMYM